MKKLIFYLVLFAAITFNTISYSQDLPPPPGEPPVFPINLSLYVLAVAAVCYVFLLYKQNKKKTI